MNQDVPGRSRDEQNAVQDQRYLADRFALLADNLPDSFWLIDVRERRIVYANPAYSTLWGASREELFNDRLSWQKYIHPEDLPRILAAVKTHKFGGVDEKVRILRPDHSLRWIHLKSFAVGTGKIPHSVGGIAFDITGHVQQQAQLDAERSAQHLTAHLKNSVIDALPGPVAIVSPNGVIFDVNVPWKNFLIERGYPTLDYGIGHLYRDIYAKVTGLQEDLLSELDAGLKVVLAGQQDRYALTCSYRSNDQEYWSRILITPLQGEEMCGAVVMHLDVTQSVAAEERIRHLVYFDGVTGLPNRAQFQERLQEAIAQGSRQPQRVTVLVLALDRFRAINESWGYATGDRLLTQLGIHLREVLRVNDVIARLSGDQFGVLLSDSDNSRDITQVARRLVEVMSHPISLEDKSFHLSASMGIAVFPEDGDDADALLQGAEAAMYRAKAAGPGNFQFNDINLNEQAREQQRLEVELREAIRKNEFALYYQPKTSCRNGRIVGLEALIRWQHPTRGLIPPSDFVPLLETTGLVVPVGEWIISTACQQIAAWLKEGVNCVPVAVNLSGKQLVGSQLYHTVHHALESSGLPPGYLDLELTESMLMDKVEDVIPILVSLKGLGIRLSVDDFGTGYSSISYLKRFPLDALKVDRSFVQDITADPNDVSITRAIITMAHALKLKVIAEGVETEGQLGLLIANHCDEIQGYYFSRPLPGEEIKHMLLRDEQLPAHLLRLGEKERTLLLVDDEENILAAMKRLLRREGYRLLSANSGEEGLDILAKERVDVILSDQRMPGITGVEFLRRAKEISPASIRMVLSGYTELQSVTSAINDGAIYKFLTKPWDDDQLKENIAEAFRRKDLSDENHRLDEEVKTANRELASANSRLEALLAQKQQQITRDETALGVFQEALQIVPWPLIGVDNDGMIATLNAQADELFSHRGMLLGTAAQHSLPPELANLIQTCAQEPVEVIIDQQAYRVLCRPMGLSSNSRGKVIILFPQGEKHG
ncbi:MAG TPA: EAL domain-containing protein [Rhodocyclaceae bacterium]|jgi:diguanylate cyclase (GGDEF)-like protein/PAS domain S-box-containing protein